ncbi:hypothetical protein CVD28_03640 [Bacillus sp. M6-12]|uniref:hypothetical protein n=1 Tax=Bacillus sp. M6-12 TaxID=2054166 RepID=UPI000C78ED3A|nr:hypothetical protein [Bacillus sp. M6-12]PLS19520.1 hypothetical protein CVD28_03640 [Bacillus sp. M6-12]
MKTFRRRAYVKAIKTEKRPAESGEKIVIVKPHHTESENGYKIGDIFTVSEDTFSESIHTTEGLALWNFEYRVIGERNKDNRMKVCKKSGKPFKSGKRVNTVKSIIDHPKVKGEKAYTFYEDDSFVSVVMCEISK